MLQTDFGAIFGLTMKRWSIRQWFVFCLAALVAVGMSASAVQTNVIVVKMAMTSDMDAAGKSCGGCEKGGGQKAMACMPACVAPALAMLPQIDPVTMPQIMGKLPLPGNLPLFGSTPPPDPYPPRPTDIG